MAGGRARRSGSGAQLARNVGVLLTGTATVQLVGLLTLPVLTRLYEPADIGLWSLYLAAVLSMGALAGLRLDLAFFMADESRTGEIAKATATAALGSAIVMGVVILAVAAVVGTFFGLSPAYACLMAVNILVFALLQLLQYRMNRTQEFVGMARLRMTQAVTTSLLQIGLALTGVGLTGLIVGTLLGHSLTLVFRIPRLVQGFESVSPRAFQRVFREFWKLPVFNGAAALADAVRLNGLNFVVSSLYSAHWLGMYSMAWRVVLMPSSLVSGALAQVYLPRFTEHRHSGLRRQVVHCGLISATVGVLPFFVLRMWGEPLFSLALGSEWAAAGVVAVNLTPYLYMSFITGPLSHVFIVTNRQGTALVFSIIYAAVPVAILFNMGPDFIRATEIMGWAMAGLLLVNVGLVFLVSSTRPPQGDRADAHGSA